MDVALAAGAWMVALVCLMLVAVEVAGYRMVVVVAVGLGRGGWALEMQRARVRPVEVFGGVCDGCGAVGVVVGVVLMARWLLQRVSVVCVALVAVEELVRRCGLLATRLSVLHLT